MRNEVDAQEFNRISPDGFGRPDTWNVEIPVKDEPKGHGVIIRNFVDAILDGEPVIAPAEEGIHSVEMANAMIYSSATDQAVDIPLDGAAYEAKLKSLIADSTFEKKVKSPSEMDIGKSFR